MGALIGLAGCFLLHVVLEKPPYSGKAVFVGIVLIVGGAELAVFNAPFLDEQEAGGKALAAMLAPVALVLAAAFSGRGSGKGRGMF
ncbi:hypothetical protein [Oerskovia rustica]|uniref:Uncharacterized protein n=1 Tax=Oerskovia rustica TaxID=2762237 RepID=A0ABR8RPB0_9CELL|nr:hypothetical protein [Oerskovia rustica]MBD7949603.1 hypothetical protein [Oerskovia rustica]